MTLAVPHVVRNYQMQLALEQRFEHLKPRLSGRESALSIVGYGPSILQTWKQISYPVMSLSGAHDFLIERGVVPDYHADCDPRVHKANFVKHARWETTYLMASCCHPNTWGYLRGRNVFLWHADNGPETREWLREHGEDGKFTLRPGPSIGTAALGLAKALGYRRVRLFGYDSCFVEHALNAGPSERPYTNEQPRALLVNGVTYLTTENMQLQAEAFSEFVEGLEYELVGEGLLKAMLQERQMA